MNPLLILGVLGAGALALGAGFKSSVKAQVKRARDELIEIGPDCSFIRLKTLSEGSSAKQIDRKLRQARKYYFGPIIEEGKRLFPPSTFPNQTVWGKTMIGFVLAHLIPECRWTPIPKPGDPRFLVYLVLGNWIRIESFVGLECDPLTEPPPGLLCVLHDGKQVLARRK